MKHVNALTIAGTDPSGGAGLQADLKSFSALGAYGASVVTALVAQNTCGVQSVYNIDPLFVSAQLDSVFTDMRIDSVKIGMLSSADIVESVAERLRHYKPAFVVLDTVMIAKSGASLLALDAIDSVRYELLPLASIVTPNLLESAKLLVCSIAKSEKQMREQGQALIGMGCQAVLIKGGHLGGAESPDWLFTAKKEQRFSSPRVATRNTHGTGCTLSAAMTALRPLHTDWETTVAASKDYLQLCLRHADTLEVGNGIGPLHHFHSWW